MKKITSYSLSPEAQGEDYLLKRCLKLCSMRVPSACLILTGEDIYKDDLLHARENVIHEAGLFQGRLGFSRSIICKEDGVEEFSNIRAIDQVRFSKGGIKEIYGEIIAIIKREFP
jgi:predicted nucleotide-binding protein